MPLSLQSLLGRVRRASRAARNSTRRRIRFPVRRPRRPLRRTSSRGSFIVDSPCSHSRPGTRSRSRSRSPVTGESSTPPVFTVHRVELWLVVGRQLMGIFDLTPPYGSSPNGEDPPMYSPAAPSEGEGTSPPPPPSVDITSAPPSPSWQQLYGEVGGASDEILNEEHRVPGMFPCETPLQSDSRSVSSLRTTRSMPNFATPNDAGDDDRWSEPGCSPCRGSRAWIRGRMRRILRFRRR